MLCSMTKRTMSASELVNAHYDNIGILSALSALRRLDSRLLKSMYADMEEWVNTRIDAHYAYVTRKRRADDDEVFRSGVEQIRSAYANDTMVNYFVERAAARVGDGGHVRVLSSHLPQFIVNPKHYMDGSECKLTKLGVKSSVDGAACCMSAADPLRVLLVPLHGAAVKHWSLLALYRAEMQCAGWFAVHYDTLSNLNGPLAVRFCDAYASIIEQHVDTSVAVSRDVLVDKMGGYVQPDGWSCGYRCASVAELVCRHARSVVEAANDDGGDEVQKSVAVRTWSELASAPHSVLADERVGRLVAEALDDVRHAELVECVRMRCKNV